MEELVERRIVTVLFADLVGFTTLSEQLDPEDIAVIQDRYFATVRETVARYGGRLEKFIGDAAMAVFGVPIARDDDAVRAVRAGLALIGGIQQIGATLGLEEDTLRLRVGVNTGEAVTAESGPDEGRVTGDTVNTAARLQAAAPPGGVLVGDTTALAVAEVAELGDVTPLELKGKAEATNARLVNGLRAEPSREEAMGGLRAPTLGRESELEALMEAARAAAESGATARWLIVAPPGVGKSRLLRELADRLAATQAGTKIWRSRARPDSVSPFDAVARLLIDALGTADRDEASARLSAAMAAARMAEGRAKVVLEACLSVGWPAVTPTDGAESGKPTDDRSALFAAWLDGLDALAAGEVQVWLVEDVHWAGGDVLAFIDAAAERSKRLIVATARPSLLEANADWAAEDAATGRHTMQLAPLAAGDARALITSLVGDALPDELVERIAERSDGNCLFIEELLRTWVSVGTLARDAAGRWRLTVAQEEVSLPASVQSIYAAQLDDLPPDARRLARRASVAGRRFPVGALRPLGATSREATGAEDGLEPLQRRELVVGPLTEPLWGQAFAYRHALLRDAGYASLARAERARLHIRLAKWLEEAAGDRSAEVAEQIAGHYAAALEAAPALAQELDAGLDRNAVGKLAADWYERAGQSTLQLSAHDAARQLLKRSIDLTSEENDLDAARRWERLGDATAFADDMNAGAQAYERAMELYRQAIDKGSVGFDAGSRAMDAAADQMAKRIEWLASISPEGAKALEDGAAELRSGAADIQAGKREFQEGMLAARSGLARTTASLADVWYQQLRFAEARDMASAALEEMDEADDASRARLLIARARGGMGASGASTPGIAEDVDHALELARRASDPQTELLAQTALATLHTETGHYTASEWEQVEQAAIKVGDWATAVQAIDSVAGTFVDDQAAKAFAPLLRGRELAMAHGYTEDIGWSHYLECEAAFVSGDWQRALAAGLHAIDLGEANAYLRLTVRTLHVLIPIATVRGDRQVIERAARWYAGLDLSVFPDSPYARIVRAAQDLDIAAAGLGPALVPEVEPRLASFRDEPGGPSFSAAIDRVLRAWLDAREIDGAGRAMAAMEAGAPDWNEPTSLAVGTYELMRGRVAHARADDASAATHATQALERFRTSGAPWWIAKAIRLLERAGTADAALIAEADQIERMLGALEATR